MNPGPLCNRAAAVDDVTQRFGQSSRGTILACRFCAMGIRCIHAQVIPVPHAHNAREHADRSCCFYYMHLLGKSIAIDVNPGTARARTVLAIDNWDFDNQGARRLPKAVDLAAGTR